MATTEVESAGSFPQALELFLAYRALGLPLPRLLAPNNIIGVFFIWRNPYGIRTILQRF